MLNENKVGLKALNRGLGIEGPVAQIIIGIFMVVSVLFVLLPLIITILTSLKTAYEASISIWTLPKTPKWSNYSVGMTGMLGNMLNSIFIGLVVSCGSAFISSIVAYVFVRHDFPGKEFIFSLIIALMVVPGVLTLTPSYLLIINLHLKNTWWAIILPCISGSQVGAIFLYRTFMTQQPKELFESAKMDGANDWVMYTKIAAPLAVPVIAIQAVGTFGAVYNDFLWPMLVIDDNSKQTLMPVLRGLVNQIVGVYKEPGIEAAMMLMSGIPLIFTTLYGLKHFINGEFASGLKL